MARGIRIVLYLPTAKRNFEEPLQNLAASGDATRKEALSQLAQGSADEGDLATAIDPAKDAAKVATDD
jgi:hypothetical protein